MIILINISCKRDVLTPNGFTKYQTFNEYALIGVSNNTEPSKSPYVFVRENIDTISVIISDQMNNVINYVNKGDYWYNIKKEQLEYTPDCKCDTTPQYFTTYIYRDTLFIYNYFMDNNKKRLNNLTIETKKNILRFNLREDVKISTQDEFNVSRDIAKSYLENFPYYAKGHQPCYYQSFTKVLKGDTLYLYETNDISQSPYLKDIRLLNSLGEFDPHKGISIINKVQDSDKCK